MFFGLFTLAVAFAALSIYALKQARTLKPHVTSAEVDERLYLPVLGVTQSGKTLLLASLGEQLTQTASDQLTTRLLTREEEQRERGRQLKSFNLDDPSQAPLKPGERTTAAMVYFERQRFERDGVNEATLVPEDAIFALQFATHGPLAGRKLCVLQDIPGEHLSEERAHEANIHPKLLKADGLVLVIDGPKALKVDAEPLPEHLLYRQALERYLARADHGPVWVVITKADLLPKDRRDEAWWREHTLTHIAPLLKLSDSETPFELSLVSAERSCELGWGNVRRAGEGFFVSLKEVLTRRSAQHRTLSYEVRKTSRLGLTSALISLMTSWGALGAYQVKELPLVSGERAWDLLSLEGALKPRLKALDRARSALSPLSLYKGRLAHELATVRVASWELVRQKADEWGASLGAKETGADQVDQVKTRTLKQALHLARTLNDARADVRPWSSDERESAELVEVALSDMKRLPSLEKITELSELKRAWRGRCKLSLHRRAEGKTPPFECSITEAINRQMRGARRAQLSAAERASVSPSDPIQLKARLTPLLSWEAENTDLEAADELRSHLKSLKLKAWQSSWFQLKQTLSEQGKTGNILDRLQSLKRFEDERVQLERSFTSDLEAPTHIRASWRDLLNSECVQAKEGGSALVPSDREALRLITEWAAPYLDPKRRARVRLNSQEERWLSGLKRGLVDPLPERFDDTLALIQRGLRELESEEGRDAIKVELTLWTEQLKALVAWRAPQRVKVSASEVSCDFKKLKAEGLDHGAGSRWDTDKFYPYLTLTQSAIGEAPVSEAPERRGPQTLILTGEVELDDGLELHWHPWSRIKLSLYEQDGSIDSLPDVDESDDHLISDGRAWELGSGRPKAKVSLTPQGSCSVDLELHHRLPEWVFERALVERPLGE